MVHKKTSIPKKVVIEKYLSVLQSPRNEIRNTKMKYGKYTSRRKSTNTISLRTKTLEGAAMIPESGAVALRGIFPNLETSGSLPAGFLNCLAQ